ncbi:hypothetical protein KAI92_01740 [Candidatus Parcubacteria bacterium]|nr:hypothetical protein [Candidatus Parcubacteria bacterium]
MSHYNKISKNIHEIIVRDDKKELTWINIVNAGKKEIEFLRKNYDFQLSHLQASSAKITSQRTFVEDAKKYTFMVLQFPEIINDSIHTGEIEFFIGKSYIVTLHNNVKALNSFFSKYKKDVDNFASSKEKNPTILLYEIFNHLLTDCYSLIDINTIKINKVEEMIFSRQSRKSIPKILFLRRDIINVRRMMQNHKNIIKKLLNQDTGLLLKNYRTKKLYIQLLDLSKRVWESLENQKEMITVLSLTNDALLNYRISDIMKTLTLFSVIVFPLTLFAALFGMNVEGGMPLLDNAGGFWIVLLMMLGGTLGMMIYFKRKRWF